MEFHMLTGSLILIFGIQVVEPQACGNPVYNSRIVGGTDADIGAWPWQVSFRRAGGHICGGSLITESWVVTAAHCMGGVLNPDSTQYTVLVGGYQLSVANANQTAVAVERIIIHENYDGTTHDNDIALVQLSSNVTYSDYIRPICLPNSTVQFPDGLLCWVTGWGNIKYEVHLPGFKTLQEVQVPIINQHVCDCLYHINSNISQNTQMVMSTSICAGYIQGGKDSCQGDSGGPLVCKRNDNVWILAGIVSWGTGCADANHPGVYALVPVFQRWLQDKLPELQFLDMGQAAWPTSEVVAMNFSCKYTRNGIATLSASEVSSNRATTFHFYLFFITILQQIVL